MKIAIAGLIATASLAALSTSANATDYTLKFGHLANENHIYNKAALAFEKEVESRSDGRIDVQIFPNEQLGSESEMISSIQLGTADMTITGEPLQNWGAPTAALLGVPYAIDDEETLKKVADGEIGKEIEAQIENKVGLVPLTWFERGPRELTSNRPIKKPSDLNGIILRLPNVPLHVKVWQALGAKATPMAFSEMFSSLQQGTIEAQENPLSLIESASLYEVQDYVNLTDHVRSWIYVVIGKNKLESMPDDLQKVITDAADNMHGNYQELFQKDQKRLRNSLEEHGMKFVEVDQDAFRDKAREAVEANLEGETLELYHKMLKVK
ncbi:TRAP transporter substrate-binding protein [Salinicola halophyticus]|uniref:TRAP transporter substrate-binding protein n=1 Tax=Salinicola halophyticus TaxID=1808881 RepID=UPI003F45D9DD